jgi:hypothetical protein
LFSSSKATVQQPPLFVVGVNSVSPAMDKGNGSAVIKIYQFISTDDEAETTMTSGVSNIIKIIFYTEER